MCCPGKPKQVRSKVQLILQIFFDLKSKIKFSLYSAKNSHVRAVVATLGGQEGAAARADKWRHLYAGFTVWLSQTEAAGNLLVRRLDASVR